MRRPKLTGIYIINCKFSKRVYIGSSLDVAIRWNSHLIDLMLGRHCNSGLQDDFNRYGITAFSFSILQLVPDKRILKKLEQQEMDKYELLYNKRRAKKK